MKERSGVHHATTPSNDEAGQVSMIPVGLG